MPSHFSWDVLQMLTCIIQTQTVSYSQIFLAKKSVDKMFIQVFHLHLERLSGLVLCDELIHVNIMSAL